MGIREETIEDLEKGAKVFRRHAQVADRRGKPQHAGWLRQQAADAETSAKKLRGTRRGR